ncbi:hypothetical protein, partial [Mesorhizobium sp.]
GPPEQPSDAQCRASHLTGIRSYAERIGPAIAVATPTRICPAHEVTNAHNKISAHPNSALFLRRRRLFYEGKRSQVMVVGFAKAVTPRRKLIDLANQRLEVVMATFPQPKLSVDRDKDTHDHELASTSP